MRAFPVLLVRYFADIVAHGLHFDQLLPVVKVTVPLCIIWVGFSQNPVVPIGANVIVEPDEGFPRRFVLEGP